MVVRRSYGYGVTPDRTPGPSHHRDGHVAVGPPRRDAAARGRRRGPRWRARARCGAGRLGRQVKTGHSMHSCPSSRRSTCPVTAAGSPRSRPLTPVAPPLCLSHALPSEALPFEKPSSPLKRTVSKLDRLSRWTPLMWPYGWRGRWPTSNSVRPARRARRRRRPRAAVSARRRAARLRRR